MSASNIETAGHTWLAETWPPHLRFTDALDIPKDDETVDPWQVVPRTFASQCDWSYVGRNKDIKDHTRGLMLLYKNPRILPNAPAGLLYPVGVRVQGFIERCNLKPLGSWLHGRAPQSALQHIVLGGGQEYQQIFQQYKAAISDVVTFIYRSLEAPLPDVDHDDTLFVGRRVFTKVTKANRMLPSALEPGDDPMDYTKAFESSWKVIRKASVGMYLAGDIDSGGESMKVPCDAMSLVEGDFVDVCVGFDIVHHCDHTGKMSFKVHLNIEHVLLLLSAEDRKYETEIEQTVAVQNPGLTF